MRALSCVALAVAILLCGTAHAGYTNCSGSVNPFPVNREAPTLVKSVANGKRYLAGKGNDTFHVLHLYGSHYDMGYAHGQLMGDYFGDVWTAFMAYMELQLEEQYPDLPPWLIDLGAAVGIPLALQLVADATYPYTPQKYLDEMHGIADGSGFDYNKVYQVNMFPEMIKAACTIVGATKSATVNGNVAHLRGLDFGVHMPLRDWPLLTIFHGDGSEPKVANFGWILMIGSLTGFSETPIGIGEKVWLDHKQGISSFNGEPWMFLLRDVLYTQNLQQALVTLANANRTCAIHVGIGDGNENEFRGVQMAHDAFEVFNWSSLDYPEHPVIKDVMYWDKHEQPSHFWCLSTLLKGYVGNITAERMATEISGYAATGNVHSVTFDYLEKVAFFANVRKSNVTAGDINAYNRQYTWLNMSALFATPL